MVAWWKELCHPFYSPLLHGTVSSGQCPFPESSTIAPPLRKSLAALFPEPFELLLSSSPKETAFKRETNFAGVVWRRNQAAACAVYTHAAPPKPNQPKDNNKTQTKPETHKKSTQDKSLVLPGGSQGYWDRDYNQFHCSERAKSATIFSKFIPCFSVFFL